jgi:galactose mutarotase-like enzyme
MGQVKVGKKENVTMRAGSCSVTILPWLGGKIASIRIGDRELLQSPLAVYAPRTRTMSFDAGDASGWDECLPSVAACTVEASTGTASVPDHGDLWRVHWRDSSQFAVRSSQLVAEASDASVTLRGECFSLPLMLERTVGLAETSTGWRLRLDYALRNFGGSAVPWSWSAHPLFVVEAGDRIVLPESIETLRLEGSGGGRLGRNGDIVSWPLAALADGSQSDLSIAQGADSGIGDKLFAGPLSDTENWCTLERQQAGVRIKVGFDAAATPYLGLWICYGGWPDRPGAKQMCVAIEPATAQVDSLAETGPWSRVLAPDQSSRWPMTVAIDSI